MPPPYAQHLLPSFLKFCLRFMARPEQRLEEVSRSILNYLATSLFFLSASAAKYCAFEHLLTVLLVIYFMAELLVLPLSICFLVICNYFMARPEHGLEQVSLQHVELPRHLLVLTFNNCCQVLSIEHLLTVLLGIYFMVRPEHGL